MSRIGKNPITVPEKVEVTVANDVLTVKGPLGTLKQAISPDVAVKLDAGKLTFATANDYAAGQRDERHASRASPPTWSTA